jgi:hypothetical protein
MRKEEGRRREVRSQKGEGRNALALANCSFLGFQKEERR